MYYCIYRAALVFFCWWVGKKKHHTVSSREFCRSKSLGHFLSHVWRSSKARCLACMHCYCMVSRHWVKNESCLFYSLPTILHIALPLVSWQWNLPLQLNSQYFWKWTNANPMKILEQLASHPKLLIGSKLSLGLQEIKFPLEEPDLVLLL